MTGGVGTTSVLVACATGETGRRFPRSRGVEREMLGMFSVCYTSRMLPGRSVGGRVRISGTMFVVHGFEAV